MSALDGETCLLNSNVNGDANQLEKKNLWSNDVTAFVEARDVRVVYVFFWAL